jgi:hypothetical protein
VVNTFCDIVVFDNCNANAAIYAYFDGTMDSNANDPGLHTETYFAILSTFSVHGTLLNSDWSPRKLASHVDVSVLMVAVVSNPSSG